jgi:heat shock protein HtpX
MKRIFLFLATNLAVVVVLGVVASLLGVNRYLTANGLNLGACSGSPSSWASAAPSSRC